MHNIIEIKDLCFSFGNNVIFDKLNFTIKNKRFVTILGKNCSGKTTLVNILMGLYDVKGKIYIDGILLNNDNKKFLRRDMGFVLENPDEQFVTSKVYDELAFVLESLDYKQLEVHEKILYIADLIGIDGLLERDISTLSIGEKQLVALACAIVNKPKILIMDEGLSNIDEYYREIILKILNIMRKKGMTIINITSNCDDAIFGTDIIIINEGKTVLNKTLARAFKEEKTFINSGLKLPFIVDLSHKLNYYNLIDKIYLDNKSLVDEIWK